MLGTHTLLLVLILVLSLAVSGWLWSDRLFAALKRHHSYILLSYAYLPLETGASDDAYAQAVHTRIVKDGWRNHMDIPGLIAKIQKVGFVEAVGAWGGSQIIFVVNCRQV